MGKVLEHFQSSELSRNSTKVFSAAENAPVLVTRRDGQDLVLMSQKEAEIQGELLEFAAQLIAVTTDDRGSLIERMVDRFSWMYALSQNDQLKCTEDLVRAARASFATQQFHLAAAELAAWKETASAIASGLNTKQVEWLDEDEVVGQPE